MRITLLHATPVAMDPIRRALAARWPEAVAMNLLDDGLSLDRTAEGAAFSGAIRERFRILGRYAVEAMGAQGILATCSAFGPVLDDLARSLPVPVIKPNAPMFEASLRYGPRIAMLATFAPAVAPMAEEFARMAGQDARLTPIFVEGALAALTAGDGAKHDALVAQAAAQVTRADAILLAQFSTARALPMAQQGTKVPVLSAPEAAVDALRSRLCATRLAPDGGPEGPGPAGRPIPHGARP